MTITFEPLAESHFPLLLKWLETPHVKAWWDQDVNWTPELIQEKYGSYITGYKLDNGVPKKIRAYIIQSEGDPIGYIQIYNPYDFPRAKPLIGLPEKLVAFDMMIGEPKYLHQGIGSQALRQVADNHCDDSDTSVFADPDAANYAAIKAYEKAGFKKVAEHEDTGEIWMVKVSSNKIKKMA